MNLALMYYNYKSFNKLTIIKRKDWLNKVEALQINELPYNSDPFLNFFKEMIKNIENENKTFHE